MLIFIAIFFAGTMPVISDILRYYYPVITVFGSEINTMQTVYPVIIIIEIAIVWGMIIRARKK